MCIIIVKPADVSLPISTVLRAYQQNPDGWGIAARTPNGIVIRRDFGTYADESILDAFDSLRHNELVIHCRIGTTGRKDLRNTHPFAVNDNLYLFHNGTLDVDRSTDPDMCDSYHVARMLAGTLGDNASATMRHPEYLKALQAFAGTSRLALLDAQGVVLVNESLGKWEDGCWYSNDSADARLAANSLLDDEPFGYDDEDLAYSFGGKYYDGIIPRRYRVETPEDEAAIAADALDEIALLGTLDVDDIAQRAAEDPEMVAEAIALLLQERRPARRAS